MSATTDKIGLNARGIAFSCIKGKKPNSATKKNQDTFSIVLWNQWKIVGVFDGHGSFGHKVSDIASSHIPFYLLEYLENKSEENKGKRDVYEAIR